MTGRTADDVTVVFMTPLRPVWTREDALGSEFAGQAGELAIRGCLPRADGVKGRLRAPDVGQLAEAIPALHPDTGLDWGGSSLAPIPGADVKHLVLLVEGASRNVRLLRPRLVEWLRGLTGWLEVWTEQVLHAQPVQRWAPQVWQRDERGWRDRPHFMEAAAMPIQDWVAQGASRADWASAASLAETPIPLVWEVVAAARQALEHDDFRRTVIESGTATEIAVAEAVRQRLRSTLSAEETERKVAVPLGPLLRQQYQRLGLASLESVDRLYDGVVKVRNDAVHRGRQPTGPEARKALREAELVAHQHVPLPPGQQRPS